MREQKSRRRAKEVEILQLLIEDRNKNFDLALEMIITKYTPFLMAIARQRGNSKEEAEDIVWKVMYDAQKDLHNEQAYPAERLQEFKLELWLITLTQNECYQRYIKRIKRPTFEPLPPDECIGSGSISRLFAHPDEIPEEDLANKELMEAILRAFDGLAVRYEILMRLFILEGWSQKDIALDLELKYATVRSRCSRGLKLLQRLVVEELRARDEEALAISLEKLIETDKQEEE